MRYTSSNGFGSRFKRARRIAAFIAACGLVIGIPLAVYFARNASTTEAGWWDELWNYRKRISLGNSGSAQTSKRVSISTDTATMITDGKLQADCDDIRFTDINGKLLEHRINKNIGIALTQTSQGSNNTNGATFTFSHKVTSGSNQALVVVYHGLQGNENPLDVTGVRIENGASDVQLTQAVESTSTTTDRSYITSIWTKADAFNGLSVDTDYDVVVTLSSNVVSHVAAAYTLTGVNQSDPVGITASNTNSGVASLTVTTGTTDTANSLLIGGSLVRADADYGQLDPPGVMTYWQQNGTDTTRGGGAGGYLRTSARGAYSLTFSSQEGSITAFNAAVVEINPVTSTTDCNTATSDLEVLVDSIPAGGTEIFMYYGNSIATSNQSLLADPTKAVTYSEDTSFDDSTSGGASGDPYSFNHTVTSSLSNTLLVAVVHGLNSQGTGTVPFRFTSVTYNGDLMQFRSRRHSYTTNRDLTTEVWVLPNPDTGGSYALEATTDRTIDKFAGAAITLYNVGQFADADWWTGGNGSTVASQTLTFTINGAARTLVGGAVETTADANQLTVTAPGTEVYAQDTGSSDNSEISAAGGYWAATPVSNTLVIGQTSGTTQHINGAGISLIADQTYAEFTPTSGPTLQSEEKSPGPVLHWKLDETSDNLCTGGVNDICDATSNLNDGTYSATRASGSSCLLGGCYQFNGTTNAITLPTASDAFVDFAGSEAFSGSAWIYVTTMPTGTDKDAVIAKWDENSNHAAYRLYVENDDSDSTGNMAVQIYDESASQVITATGTTDAIAQNTWYHVAFSFNGGASGTAGDLKIYVNGSYQAQNILNGSFAGLENLASDFTVADYDANDSTSGNTAFTGTIDELKMFAYTRSAEHMKNDYLIGSTASGSNVVLGGGLTPMPTPIIHWKFDEGSGAVANNSGSNGSGDNGTIASGTWSLSGKFNKALTFTASTSVTDTITDPGNTNTLSLWVYPTSSAISKTLITTGKLATDGSGQPTYGTCTGTALSVDTWTHIVAVSNGAGSCTIYQNGVATSTNTGGVTFGTTLNVGVTSFTGSIDEVKVYDDALSADQVKVDFNGDAAINLGSGVNERSALTDGDYQSTLVAHWPLDENADNTCTGGTNDVCDRSGNSNNGANNASPIWVPGKFGSALNYLGSSSQYTSITGPSSVKTISFWVNPQDDTEPLLNITSTTDYITSSSGTVTATGFASPSIYVNGILNGTITGNYWNHVVVASDTAENASALYFGRANSSYLTGSIDEVRLFSTKLTQAQVSYEFSRGKPIAWYRLDECVGATANDAAEVIPLPTLRPNGTITIGGTGTYTTTGNCVSGTSTHSWYAGATGKIGSALGFDDTNDYITIADQSVLDLTSGLSITAWVKPAANEADNVIVSKGTSYEMGLTADGDVYFYNGTGTVDDESAKATSGTWYHVAITNNDTTTTFYVNGVNTGTDALGIGADNSTNLYIGYDGTNYFDGLIDDVQLFNYPLSATQIKSFTTGGSIRFE